MSEQQDKSSKTEEPTEKRLRKAREEGNFAKAEEIQVVFGLIAAFGILLFTSGKASKTLAVMMSKILGSIADYQLNVEMVVQYGREGVAALSGIITPVLAAAVLAAILAGGLQSGFRASPKAIGFKGNKINPINGFKQKYGMQSLVKFGIDFLKFIGIASVVAFGIRRITRHEIFHTRVAPAEIGVFILQTTLFLLSLLILTLGMIAVLNFLYQKHKTHQDLKMTKQEVKDEHKQQEGDPQVKSAQRQMARAMAQRQMFAAIPDADVVVTNPTHYAIALRYDRSQDAAPMILARGRNLIAQKIKRIGRENGVPVIENKPVAQALYKMGKVGTAIPPQLYKVVAQVLAYAYQTHRRYFYEKEKIRRRKR
ncbi:MAG: flagellar biosynthesis protein FlhB [Puniceicoccaceae bacterium]